MREWSETLDMFRKALIKAQEQRKNKKEWVADPNDNNVVTPEWILFERQTMLDLTNEERKLNNLPPVTIQQIIRAENCACGHTDYTHKFALYCARMSRGENGYE